MLHPFINDLTEISTDSIINIFRLKQGTIALPCSNQIIFMIQF